jgi:hypothetical protein
MGPLATLSRQHWDTRAFEMLRDLTSASPRKALAIHNFKSAAAKSIFPPTGGETLAAWP